MKILAIDTATEACSAALSIDGELHERYVVAGRSHTELLLPMVRELMAEAGCSFKQLDGIACGIGPGSFAGVRIGVGYAKGVALALDLPVVGVSSLAMLAQGHARAVPVIDARTQEIYWGVYENGIATGVDTVSLPQEISVAGEGWAGIGSGWKTYGEILTSRISGATVIGAEALPHAAAALALALPEFVAKRTISGDALVPAYLRNKVALTLLEQADLRRRNKG
jgi:tRNA threonylcarbamoyladenosine biosynthesis protein TsaB